MAARRVPRRGREQGPEPNLDGDSSPAHAPTYKRGHKLVYVDPFGLGDDGKLGRTCEITNILNHGTEIRVKTVDWVPEETFVLTPSEAEEGVEEWKRWHVGTFHSTHSTISERWALAPHPVHMSRQV
jgi:hypothetical protein